MNDIAECLERHIEDIALSLIIKRWLEAVNQGQEKLRAWERPGARPVFEHKLKRQEAAAAHAATLRLAEHFPAPADGLD
jgi:hypothetical protein